MAGRTTTTRTTGAWCALSADLTDAPTFEELVKAYYDCRRHKRNTNSARQFEQQLETNLLDLYDELIGLTYQPGRSICFVVTWPKPREVWAAEFRDRIVHHLLYNRIGASTEATFIADSCACIPTRGTLYAAYRVESKIRSATQNWSQPCSYLKADLANFFVSIDKRILDRQLRARIKSPWWRRLALRLLWHDPRKDYEMRCPPALLKLVPAHKRLGTQPAHRGLPIGNLSSQFFANIYLDELDQFVKHQLRCRHYIRYVDDIVLLHESPQQLNAWLAEIERFLPRLNARLNPSKTILQPVYRGVDFVGHVIKPWRRTTRRKTVREASRRLASTAESEAAELTTSYFGLLRQASHSLTDRQRLARKALRQGLAVNSKLTKAYAKKPRHK